MEEDCRAISRVALHKLHKLVKIFDFWRAKSLIQVIGFYSVIEIDLYTTTLHHLPLSKIKGSVYCLYISLLGADVNTGLEYHCLIHLYTQQKKVPKHKF